MGLRFEPVAGLIRFSPEPEPGGLMPPYDASATVVWETEDTLWVKGLAGKFRRSYLLDLLRWADERGIRHLKASRASGHVLPRVQPGPDGIYTIDVRALRRAFDPAYMDSQP